MKTIHFIDIKHITKYCISLKTYYNNCYLLQQNDIYLNKAS